MKFLNGAMLRTLQFGSMALATGALVACGGGSGSGGPPVGTVSGTAAVGAALANASITLSCKNGSGSATSDASGVYSATFAFDGPCTITATGGGITIHSFAAGAGTFNVTPLTELLLDYIAGQLGTTVSGLLSGISSNASFQSALSNGTVIANAQAAVAKLINDTYAIELSSSSFLTVSFTSSGADADLDTLLAADAITANGQPVASLVSAAQAAGTAAPISGGNNGGGATGGTGGSGGTGTTTK
ncbi:hypothetical protein DR64_8697 [Paraburkholderia xenovorans LB400]|uniref:Lipoprotein n=1 Tax=Paraburkholderia xenovorans (strain LB400) TaxID=266265 RepID=Q13G20_PARXL|nr:hypothetical protein [Paraburkholderia xenovorans]ABE36969.1 Conserved hypothetical protein [Paraburkholderia xenovorans LB400]AIP34328.1 hypothetical protein DR64_8697 [Paraburkholderia xenovorans LB400]